MNTVTLTNVIIIGSCFPILPIMYFILRSISKPKKNIILGVTLPYSARQDESVMEICRFFRKRLGITSLILTALLAVPFFIEYISIATTYLMVWICAVIIAPFAPYAKSHKKLKRLKQEKNWVTSAAGKVMLDTKVSVHPHKQASAWLFLPPAIISLVPVVHALFVGSDPAFTFTYIIMALICAVFYFVYRAQYRQSSEVIDENTSLSIALTRIRRHYWRKIWVWMSWATGLFNVAFWLTINSFVGMMVTTGVYVCILLFVFIGAEFSVRKAQEKLTMESGKGLYVDSDEYWILGLLYHNPNDKRTMINDRIGMGMSVNMAKPIGKILMGFAAVCIVAMPFFGLFIIPEEFATMRIEIADHSIRAYHTSLVFDVPLEDIREIELLDVLPKTSRTAGTAFDTLLKGNFRVEDVGPSKLCLNPTVAPFILIITDTGTYIFGTNDSAQTREMYETIGETATPGATRHPLRHEGGYTEMRNMYYIGGIANDSIENAKSYQALRAQSRR